MRIARALVAGEPRIVVGEAGVFRIAPRSHPDDALTAIESVRAGEAAEWHVVEAASLHLLAPVAGAGKIVAVGLNYADHTTETGFAQPARPLTFAKYSTSLTGPSADIVVPDHITQQVDYEAELTLVIGRRCGGTAPVTLDDVAGYTVANDVSARDVQFGDTQWTRGKSFDTFTPLGPWIVTPDEFRVAEGHGISTAVDGLVVQNDSTSSLIFDIPALLAFIGDGVTLEPGDLILTGTPAGAGAFVDPPRYLQHGETVVCAIEGIGELRNRVVFASQAAGV
jgi:2-keto-4-pentenoate hydratase/2-oxohepta-3-ene-1,7-dioic acid hydratase in catechol pathway